MAKLLFAWELGGGSGHVAQIAALAGRMLAAGHSVVVALREPARAAGLLDGERVTVLQSPYKPPTNQNGVCAPRTFAHVLWNAGFGDPAELQARAEAWARLIDSVGPDLIVFDHAPTALLAARGRQVKRAVIGNGFCCPPDQTPLPDLRPWMPPEAAALLDDERRALDSMNRVLERRGAAPLERVAQLYGKVDETLLTTLAEFDHYPGRGRSVAADTLTPCPSPERRGEEAALTPCPSPERRGEEAALTPCPSPERRGEEAALTPCPSPGRRGEEAALTPCPSPGGRGETRYRGPWSLGGGERPQWPAGKGPRIYAYLARFPGLPKILNALRAPAARPSSSARLTRRFKTASPRRTCGLKPGGSISSRWRRSATRRSSTAARRPRSAFSSAAGRSSRPPSSWNRNWR